MEIVITAHVTHIGGYHEEQLSTSLKRKHFTLLGNTQQLVAQALSEHGKRVRLLYVLIT